VRDEIDDADEWFVDAGDAKLERLLGAADAGNPGQLLGHEFAEEALAAFLAIQPQRSMLTASPARVPSSTSRISTRGKCPPWTDSGR
jgi:hypothetical protein